MSNNINVQVAASADGKTVKLQMTHDGKPFSFAIPAEFAGTFAVGLLAAAINCGQKVGVPKDQILQIKDPSQLQGRFFPSVLQCDLPLIGTTAMTKFNSALFVAVAIAAMGALARPAAAIEYPWCAQYSGSGGGARNCGFVSSEQCMETIRGMGGFCERNLFYTGPTERPANRVRRHRHNEVKHG